MAEVAGAWHIACETNELMSKPLAISLFETSLVLFRTEDGEVAALLDRCPHRDVPLSLGEVDRNVLRCAHHGWEFDASGACVHQPGMSAGNCSARAYQTREEQGVVWVFIDSSALPHSDSPR